MYSVWFPYRARSDTFMPILSVELSDGGKNPASRPFVLDSGAGKTLAPRFFAEGVLSIAGVAEKDTGLLDAQGKPILGSPVDVTLTIAGIGPLQETVWFCEHAKWGLLGQSAVFERLAARFHNFDKAPKGRRFSLGIPVFD